MVATLPSVVREGYSEKVELELKPEEGVSHVSLQERALQPDDQLVQRPRGIN